MTIDEIHQSRDDAVEALRRAVRYLGLVAVISVVATSLALFQNRSDAQNNRERIADIEQTREENQVGSCIQTNVLIEGARRAVVGGAEALLAISSQFTDAQKATIITTYRDAIELALPFRDCSTRGIADFLDHPPPDPGTK